MELYKFESNLCQQFVKYSGLKPKCLGRGKKKYKIENLLHRLLVLILLQFTEGFSASRDINNLTRKKMFLSSLNGPWYWPETNKLFKTSVSVSSICVGAGLFVRLPLWKYRFTFTESCFPPFVFVRSSALMSPFISHLVSLKPCFCFWAFCLSEIS